MQIGELARRTGIRPSALRYYEALGLLPVPERRSGRRRYGTEALDRLAFIRFAQTCGFQLDEVGVLLGVKGDRGPISARWQALAARKIDEVEAMIATARGMKRFLEASLSCQCVSADECGRIIRSRSAPPGPSTDSPIAKTLEAGRRIGFRRY